MCSVIRGSSAEERGPSRQESHHPRWRDHKEPSAGGRRTGNTDRSTEEELMMEERRTKALNLLSMLQEETPLRPNATTGFSNFEDCEFIVKSSRFQTVLQPQTQNQPLSHNKRRVKQRPEVIWNNSWRGFVLHGCWLSLTVLQLWLFHRERFHDCPLKYEIFKSMSRHRWRIMQL